MTVAEAKAALNTDGTEGSDGDVSVVQSRLDEQQNEIQELKKTLAEQREEAEKQKQRADDLGNQLEEKVSTASISFQIRLKYACLSIGIFILTRVVWSGPTYL